MLFFIQTPFMSEFIRIQGWLSIGSIGYFVFLINCYLLISQEV